MRVPSKNSWISNKELNFKAPSEICFNLLYYLSPYTIRATLHRFYLKLCNIRVIDHWWKTTVLYWQVKSFSLQQWLVYTVPTIVASRISKRKLWNTTGFRILFWVIPLLIHTAPESRIKYLQMHQHCMVECKEYFMWGIVNLFVSIHMLVLFINAICTSHQFHKWHVICYQQRRTIICDKLMFSLYNKIYVKIIEVRDFHFNSRQYKQTK